MNPSELKSLLARYTGTENHWQAPLSRRFRYSDGAKAMFDNAGAYWLLDILSTQSEICEALSHESFLVVLLKARDGKAQLSVSRDVKDGKPVDVAYRRRIDYTDFPEGEWRLYIDLVDVGRYLIFLPSEY